MSWYYNQDFISPEQVYSRVKEEFRSYFEAGMVDDLLFPIWTNDCIRRFRKSALKIQEALLFIESYEAKLPPDFISVREARACWIIGNVRYNIRGSFYLMATTSVSTNEDESLDISCCIKPCNSNSCITSDDLKIYDEVLKTNEYTLDQVRISHLLKPGNISARNVCATGCENLTSDSQDTFDVKDGKFVTNFREGTVYLLYYAKELDDNAYQMIPDNYFFARYLEAYLKYKVIEQLWNQVTDESFNQIQTKYQIYEQKMSEAFVLAEQEFRSQTIQQKLNSISANRRRLHKFRIR
jgi:hypothetical protein